MTFQTLVIDDALPQEYADSLEKLHSSPDIPWFYNEDISVGDKRFFEDKEEFVKTPGFNHTSLNGKKIVSRFYTNHHLVPEFVFKKINFTKKYELINARAFMLLPTPKTKEYAAKHIDLHDPHLVVLYYVNDSDGDTFFFGKDISNGISQKISPKKNRAIIFDGSIYHAGSLPSREKRIILNYNLKIID